MHQSDLDPSDVATLAVCFLEAGEFERAAFTLERAHGGPPSALSRPRIDGGGFREPCTVDVRAGGDAVLLPRWPASSTAPEPPLRSPTASSRPADAGHWTTLEVCVWAHASLMGGERRATERRLAGGDPLKGPVVASSQAAQATTKPHPASGAARAPVNPAAGVVSDALLPLWRAGRLDPPAAAVLGAALRRRGHLADARAVLAAAAVSMPLLWSAWLELAQCCASPADVPILPTDHWAAHLFAAHVLRETGRAAASLASLVHVVGPEEPTPPRAAAHAAAPTDRRPPPAVRTAIAVSRPFRRETALALYALRRLAPARALLASLHADDPFDMSVVAPLSDCLFVTVSAASPDRPAACPAPARCPAVV